ncbi:ArsR family transcriptional regulator [Clostridiaceae bacterium]|nr:ArsR family transcriptional regulator [Clostridiaceae bacterium]RKI16149.1 ArsR family transcriptional regulator [bacterium 1XD21-70]
MPLFIALGDEMRLNIIEILSHAAQNGKRNGLNVNEITSQVSLSRPAISHHLKILKDSGLVKVQESGTSNYYRLTLKESTQRLMKLGFMVEDVLSPE